MKIKSFTPIVLVTLVLSYSGAGFAYAGQAQSTFNVNVQITSADTTAPTVPTGLSVTAVSTSQINLTWVDSTDSVGVTGYRVFRDAVQIATSTSASYIDGGLQANTTYTYTVSAFDAAGNISAVSVAAQATTLSNTPNTPGGGGGGGPPISAFQINSIVAIPNFESVQINFKTSVDTQIKVSWGKTIDLELGTVSGIAFEKDHTVTIDDLEPDTKYYYKIEAIDRSGNTERLEGLSFRTQIENAVAPLANVQDLHVTPAAHDTVLDWKNPDDPRFDGVRVVRSYIFYPADPHDGETIYDGKAETWTDSTAEVGKTYYYTVFTKDTKGTYSSGAITQARIPVPGEVYVSPPTPTDVYSKLPLAHDVHPLIQKLSLSDFEFIQPGHKTMKFSGGLITIDGNENLTISLDYNKLPEVLKTIAITLQDPTDPQKTFSFLLRVNKEKTAYQATIGSLKKAGMYGLSIVILDYKNQGLKKIEGNVLAAAFESLSQNLNNETNARNLVSGFIGDNFLKLLLLLLLVIAALHYIEKILQRKKRDEETPPVQPI